MVRRLYLRCGQGCSVNMAEKVTNGTCETWGSATDLTSWTESLSGTSTVNREGTEQYAGTYCSRHDIDSSNNRCRISQTFSLTAGNPYVLSIWYKMSTTGKTGTVNIFDATPSNVGLESDGSWVSVDGADFITLANQTTWTRYTLPFTAHASYTNYTIEVNTKSAASSSIYVDNISIIGDLADHESDGITLADVGGSGRQVVYDSVSIKDDFKYYLASSEGKIFTYSGDYLSDDGSVILSRWRSKTLDFSDQLPQCLDRMKEVTGVKLIYKDITTSTNVTVYVSSDGGTTWEHETKSLGTGTGEILSATYHFIKTGEYFIFAIEHASTDKEFMWLRMEADVVPLGPYIEI